MHQRHIGLNLNEIKLKKQKSLHAKAETTSLKGGTKKVKNKLVQRLLEYGTMGLSLQKDLPGFPWYVKNVLDGGAAQRYGAQKGDILNTIDGHPIVSTPIATIYHMLCGRRGEVRTLGINRSGKDMYLRVQLISVYDIGNRPLLTLAVVLGLAGIQLFCFGLLGELLIRTYHESQGRPIYRIRATLRGGRTV